MNIFMERFRGRVEYLYILMLIIGLGFSTNYIDYVSVREVVFRGHAVDI